MANHRSGGPRARLTVTALEGRVTPATVAPVAAVAAGAYAVGADQGQTGTATVYNADGSVQFQISPYGLDFTGGVRVALADVTGDGTPDLITAPGPGVEPTVKVYDGSTQLLVDSFDAYESSFTGGVYVAAADFTGDAKAEIVTGADQTGGSRVRVFDGASVAAGGSTPTTLDDFLAIADPNFRGGVRLGTGDINGDGVSDLLVGAGFGGGPRVAGFDGASLGRGEQVKLFADFFVFELGLRNGINVGVGDVNGDGRADLIFGGGPGGGPRVRVADAARVLAGGGGGSLDDMAGAQIANFFAGDPASRAGVRVGTARSADGTDQVVGLDVASHALTAFTADGAAAGSLDASTGGQAGFYCSSDGSMDAGTGQTAGETGTGSSGGTDSTQTATHFLLLVDRQAYAGASTRVTVVALDASNRRVRDYTGTVHLTDTDSGATVPADYTFTAADRGAHTFTITPSAVGSETVTATDTATSSTTGSVVLNVTTAPAVTHFAVLAWPRVEAGEPTGVVVAALDANSHIVPTYTGTVHFTSTDAAATLPADYTFTAADGGVHRFSVTLATPADETTTATQTGTGSTAGSSMWTVTCAGGQAVTVTDTADSSLTGSANVVVKSA